MELAGPCLLSGSLFLPLAVSWPRSTLPRSQRLPRCSGLLSLCCMRRSEIEFGSSHLPVCTVLKPSSPHCLASHKQLRDVVRDQQNGSKMKPDEQTFPSRCCRVISPSFWLPECAKSRTRYSTHADLRLNVLGLLPAYQALCIRVWNRDGICSEGQGLAELVVVTAGKKIACSALLTRQSTCKSAQLLSPHRADRLTSDFVLEESWDASFL